MIEVVKNNPTVKTCMRLGRTILLVKGIVSEDWADEWIGGDGIGLKEVGFSRGLEIRWGLKGIWKLLGTVKMVRIKERSVPLCSLYIPWTTRSTKEPASKP